MVPVPRAASWEELNAQLLEQCRQRRERKLWGHEETIAERFELCFARKVGHFANKIGRSAFKRPK